LRSTTGVGQGVVSAADPGVQVKVILTGPAYQRERPLRLPWASAVMLGATAGAGGVVATAGAGGVVATGGGVTAGVV